MAVAVEHPLDIWIEFAERAVVVRNLALEATEHHWRRAMRDQIRCRPVMVMHTTHNRLSLVGLANRSASTHGTIVR